MGGNVLLYSGRRREWGGPRRRVQAAFQDYHPRNTTTVPYCEIESLDNLSALNQVIPADLIRAIAHSNLWPICSYSKFCVILRIPHFAAATHAAKLNHVALFSAIMVCPGRVPRPGNLLTQRRRRKNQEGVPGGSADSPRLPCVSPQSSAPKRRALSACHRPSLW